MTWNFFSRRIVKKKSVDSENVFLVTRWWNKRRDAGQTRQKMRSERTFPTAWFAKRLAHAVVVLEWLQK